MAMIEVNTSDLIGPALDWAVAYNLNGEPVFFEAFGARMLGLSITTEVLRGNISPSTNWEQGGPLIEKNDWSMPYRATARYHLGKYEACTPGGFPHNGPTMLIAACRAIVAAEHGTTVQVPAELMPKSEK